MIHENCKGCSSLTTNAKKKLFVCFNIDTDAIDSCPCQTCLIKSMCSQVCDDYIILFRRVSFGVNERNTGQ
jgi:hypothetical protein